MNIKTILKFAFPVVFLFGIVAGGYYLLFLPQLNRNKPANTATIVADKLFGWRFPVAKFPLTGSDGKLIAYSSIRDPGGLPQGLPVTLKIPSIGVNSSIEDALITPDGRMDVPAGTVNVAWFSLGPHPGQVGSAVIGGHFGIENGAPFVFYKLDQVKVGDKVYIVDDKGDTLAFQVRRIQSFDRNADATTVFTSQDGKAHLNLITCEGTWNAVNGNYPQRLVLFTDAIPGEGGIAVAKPTQAAVKPSLPQTAVGKPTAPSEQGVSPSSSTATSASPEPSAIELNVTPSSEKTSPLSPQVLIASAKGLYATPIDGFITSLLLLSIAYITFKIVKR
jgi:LPXTG-site transpeptidase (sortase) family protein